MPTYDYQCTTCGKRFDVTQSIKADTLTHCPEASCEQVERGKGLVERVISGGSGVIYTGGGFYLTDYVYKPGGSKEESKGDASSKAESTSKGDTSSKAESTSKGDTSSKAESTSKGDTSSKAESTSKDETSSKGNSTPKSEPSTKTEPSSKAESTAKKDTPASPSSPSTDK